ncbi:MAG: CPBP family glutamic-type intramembrane protease [bacterium]
MSSVIFENPEGGLNFLKIFASSALWLCLIPCFWIIITKQSLRDYGVRFGENLCFGVKILMLYLVSLLILFAAARFLFPSIYDAFSDPYGMPEPRKSVVAFCVFLALLLAYFSMVEFFFRGFLFFALKKIFSDWTALSIAMIPYVLAHVSQGLWPTIGSIAFALFSGISVMRTHTVIWAILMHWSLNILIFVNLTWLR